MVQTETVVALHKHLHDDCACVCTATTTDGTRVTVHSRFYERLSRGTVVATHDTNGRSCSPDPACRYWHVGPNFEYHPTVMSILRSSEQLRHAPEPLVKYMHDNLRQRIYGESSNRLCGICRAALADLEWAQGVISWPEQHHSDSSSLSPEEYAE